MKKILSFAFFAGVFLFVGVTVANAALIDGSSVQTNTSDFTRVPVIGQDSGFRSGDPVGIFGTGINVRSGAGTSYSIIGTVGSDDVGIVIGGPAISTYYWYKVLWEKGIEGWVAGQFLIKMTDEKGDLNYFGLYQCYKMQRVLQRYNSEPGYSGSGPNHREYFFDCTTGQHRVLRNTLGFPSGGDSQTGQMTTMVVTNGTSTPSSCGDVNKDGVPNIVDVNLVVDVAYRNKTYPSYNTDVNGSGATDSVDVAQEIDYIFRGGPEPTGCIDQQNQPPVISYITPTSTFTGGTVYVYGLNFDQDSFIALDGSYGSSIMPTSQTPYLLTFVVPSSTSAGFHTVQVGQKASSLPLSNAVSLYVIGSTNQPPVVTYLYGPEKAIPPGVAVPWYGQATDADTPTLQYGFSWGDGSPTEYFSGLQGVQVGRSHAYTNAGSYLVQFSASDGNSSSSRVVHATVGSSTTNQPPVVNSFFVPSSVVVGSNASVLIKATDPEGAQLSYSLNWGDNSLKSMATASSGVWVNFNHTYNAAGVYSVSSTVNDGQSSGWAFAGPVQIAVTNPTSTPTSTIQISAVPLGVSSGRSKNVVDNLANVTLTAGSAGSVYLNKMRVTFSGSAPSGTPSFLSGVTLIDENGISVGTRSQSGQCSTGFTCWAEFSFGSSTPNYLISAGTTRVLTLRVNSTLTAPAQQGVAQTLTATIQNWSDVRFTDYNSGQIIYPNISFPLPVNSVSYAMGTFLTPPTNITPLYQQPTIPPATIAPTTVTYPCGDLDKNGVVNITDLKLMQSYWTGGVTIPAGVNTDLNGDGLPANIIDYTLLNNYLYKGGAAPTCGASSGGGTRSTIAPAASVLEAMQSQLEAIRSQLISILQKL